MPTIIFITILILAWKKPRIGAILFTIAGLGTIIVFNTYRDLVVLSIISLLPIINEALLWLSKKS